MNKKTLTNNIKALKEVCPDMVTWLTSQSLADWIIPIKSENGKPNLLIKQGAKKIPVYDMKDPKKKSRETVKGMFLHRENINVVIGMGLGYLPKAILNRMEKGHKVIVVEPVAHMVILAFSLFNFSKYLKNGSLIIAPGKVEAAAIIGILDARLAVENWLVTINEYTTVRIDEYKEITEYVFKIINQTRCNIGTVATSGHLIADNDIVSLPYVIRHRGIKELQDLFPNKPAVLVSTGPSLRKNIHELLDIQDKVVIIAVAQALRPLLAYDIRPDFICTVDFGEVNMSHLEGIMDSDVPLVALNRTYAPLLQRYRGPKFIVATGSAGMDKTSSGVIKEKGYIDQGGSVAHLCLSLAHYMGCNPMVLMGQDLAYEDGLSHTPLVDSGGTVEIEEGSIQWKVEDQRSHLSEGKHSMGPPCSVPGYFGKMVITNTGLASFITSFEAMASVYEDRTLINATEGGARIKGIDPMMFRDFVKEYKIGEKENVDKSILIPLLTLAEDADELIERVIPLLKEDIKNLQYIQEQSKLGLDTNGEMEKILEEKKEKNVDWTKEQTEKLLSLFKINKKQSREAYSGAEKNVLVALAIYDASRAISGRRLNFKKERAKNIFKDLEYFDNRLESNKLILTSAKEASEKLEKSYQKTLDLLEEYRKTKDEELLTSDVEDKINLEDAKDYFQSGNFAHPLLDARKEINILSWILADNRDGSEKHMKELEDQLKRTQEIEAKALDMRNTAIEEAKKIDKKYQSKLLEYNKLIEEGQREGKENKDFSKAVELLEKANELLPDKPEARWGIATAYYHTEDYDKSIEVYKKLIQDFPDNLDFRFEHSQVLIASGRVLEGLKVIEELMKETSQYDHFLKAMGKLYQKEKMYSEAIIAYENYLNKYEADYDIREELGKCMIETGRETEGKEAINRARQTRTGKRQKNYFENLFEEIKKEI